MKTRMEPLSKPERISWSLLLIYAVGTPLCFVLALFPAAGTLAWADGWVFFLDFLSALTVSAVYLWRVNPEIYVARSRIRKGTKGWDKILLVFLLPLVLAVYPVAAMDVGRHPGRSLPWLVRAVGYVLMLAGLALTTWTEAVNPFFEPGVRVQKDRGHRVVDTGPYAIIRHPGYASAVPFLVGTALALGSIRALVPVVAATLLLIPRTLLEERTLRAELPGYAEYTQRVRYRWLPGVW